MSYKNYEEFLKNHLCPHCHIGFLEKYSDSNILFKCYFCGFTREIKKEINPLHRIINGKPK